MLMNKLNKALSLIVLFLSICCIIEYLWIQYPRTIPTANIPPSSQQPTNTEAAKKYTIGWSVFNASLEYFQALQQGVLDEAEKLGIQVLSFDQKNDSNLMVTGTLDLINQGIDALIISPYDPSKLEPIVNAAKEKNIPVVVIDQGTGGTDVDAFIISDNFAGGILAGEYALNLIKDQNITSKNAAIIRVEEFFTYARRRGEGFRRVLEENNYNIVADVTANSDTNQAYEAMKQILACYGNDLAVVFAENDNMALGAAKAIDEAGKKGQIMLIGFDGIPSAIAAIKEGSMQGTIAQQPHMMGELGVEVANRLLNKEPIIYDNRDKKELYMEVTLIDETGDVSK